MILHLFAVLMRRDEQVRHSTFALHRRLKLIGGVDGNLHFAVPSMNRLNQTEPATFSIFRVALSLGILYLSILYVTNLRSRKLSRNIKIINPHGTINYYCHLMKNGCYNSSVQTNEFRLKKSTNLSLWLLFPNITLYIQKRRNVHKKPVENNAESVKSYDQNE
jgi:hypothetical protein